jgi:hypothetical protein
MFCANTFNTQGATRNLGRLLTLFRLLHLDSPRRLCPLLSAALFFWGRLDHVAECLYSWQGTLIYRVRLCADFRHGSIPPKGSLVYLIKSALNEVF